MQQPDAEQLVQAPRDGGEAEELFAAHSNASRIAGGALCSPNSSFDSMVSSAASDSTTTFDLGTGAALRETPLATSTPRKNAKSADVSPDDSGLVDAETSGILNSETAWLQVPLELRPAASSSSGSWFEQQVGGGCWKNGEGAALWAEATGRNPVQICVSLAAATQREPPYCSTWAATTHTSTTASNASSSQNGKANTDALTDPRLLSVCRLLTDKHYGPGLLEALRLQNKYPGSCLWICPCPLALRNIERIKSAAPDAFSPKVFLGGVPFDVTEHELQRTFHTVGPLSVEWPSTRDSEFGVAAHVRRNGACGTGGGTCLTGRVSPTEQSDLDPIGSLLEKGAENDSKRFCYAVFDNSQSVAALVAAVAPDSRGELYVRVRSRQKPGGKDTQVIPWLVSDSHWTHPLHAHVAASARGGGKAFVGALHGMVTAELVARIFEEQFGRVLRVDIEAGAHQYPKGSGSVVFDVRAAFVKAIAAKRVIVHFPRVTKAIQIDPFFEADETCVRCGQLAAGFCRHVSCCNYFCDRCLDDRHRASRAGHEVFRKPRATRNEKAARRDAPKQCDLTSSELVAALMTLIGGGNSLAEANSHLHAVGARVGDDSKALVETASLLLRQQQQPLHQRERTSQQPAAVKPTLDELVESLWGLNLPAVELPTAAAANQFNGAGAIRPMFPSQAANAFSSFVIPPTQKNSGAVAVSPVASAAYLPNRLQSALQSDVLLSAPCHEATSATVAAAAPSGSNGWSSGGALWPRGRCGSCVGGVGEANAQPSQLQLPTATGSRYFHTAGAKGAAALWGDAAASK